MADEAQASIANVANANVAEPEKSKGESKHNDSNDSTGSTSTLVPAVAPVMAIQTKKFKILDRQEAIVRILRPHDESDSDVDDDDMEKDESDRHVPAVRVKALWVEYLRRILPDKNWLAVWSPKEDADSVVCVDVVSVNVEDLSAIVQILHNSTSSLGYGTEESVIVPLIELHPIMDADSEDDSIADELSSRMEAVAVALDHCRFFYANIWKPWDETDDSEDWPEEHLAFRFGIYQDYLQEGEHSKHWVLFQELAAEYNDLQEAEEFEVEEDDDYAVALMWSKETREAEIRRRAYVVENPVLRASMLQFEQQEIRDKRGNCNAKAVNIVWSGGPAHVLQELLAEASQMGPDSHVEIQADLKSAFSRAIPGDAVLLPPGRYVTPTLGELWRGGMLVGIGKEEETVVLCKAKYSDVSNFAIKNVTLQF